MKQALDNQGMYREQENSHLEWPGRTPGELELWIRHPRSDAEMAV